MSGKYCDCSNHIRDSHKTIGGHIGLCRECCYTSDKVRAYDRLTNAVLENAEAMIARKGETMNDTKLQLILQDFGHEYHMISQSDDYSRVQRDEALSDLVWETIDYIKELREEK